MDSKPTREFAALLAEVYGNYGKPIPDAAVVGAWWRALAPFPQRTVVQAFSAYSLERPDFAPVPNSIAARCRLLDGRPDDNEAWAIALSSQDEIETVVWTGEMSEAFLLCKPLMASGDEIGARMAFKDAYGRLVAAARAANRPVAWSVSPGWDGNRRAVAVNKAVVAGLLAAPDARVLLPNGATDAEVADQRPEGLKRLMDTMRELENPADKAERHREERIAADESEDRARKDAIDDQVRAYFQAHPEARYKGLIRTTKGKP